MTSSPESLSRVESLADIINNELPSICHDFSHGTCHDTSRHTTTPFPVTVEQQKPHDDALPPTQTDDSNDDLINLSHMNVAEALKFLSTKLSHAFSTINEQQVRITALSDELAAHCSEQKRAQELETEVSSLQSKIVTKDSMIEKLQSERVVTQSDDSIEQLTKCDLLFHKQYLDEPDKEYSPDEVESLVSQVQAFMEKTGMKQHAIAKRMGCSQGTLSSWLKLKYAGDVNRITYRAQLALNTLKTLPLEQIKEAGIRTPPTHNEGVVVRRKNFSREQVEILEQVARNTPNPSSEVVEKLSQAFMREPRHIVKWFSNWRSRKLPRATAQMANQSQILAQSPLLAQLPLSNMHQYAHLFGNPSVMALNQQANLANQVLGGGSINNFGQQPRMNEVLQLGNLRTPAPSNDPAMFNVLGNNTNNNNSNSNSNGPPTTTNRMQVETLNLQIQQLHQQQQQLQQLQQQQHLQQQQQQQQNHLQQQQLQVPSAPPTPLGVGCSPVVNTEPLGVDFSPRLNTFDSFE